MAVSSTGDSAPLPIESNPTASTVWPSGLRRWLQAPVRKGVGSNPTAVIFYEKKGNDYNEEPKHLFSILFASFQLA